MKFCLLALAAIACALIPLPARSHGVKAGAIEIVHPWTTASKEAPTGPVSVYFVMRNKGKTTDRLLKASSPLAARIELPPGGIEIAPGAEIVLSRKTVSLRLFGVKKPLHPYDTFPVTLEFQRAGRIAAEVLVEEETATEPAHN